MDDLINQIFLDLSLDIGLEQSDERSSNILLSKIRNAINDVKIQRNYQSYHTEDFINSDIKRFYSNIRALALYDWNKRGVEGQSSHSSNGTSRGYEDRNKCFNGIIPFADVVL